MTTKTKPISRPMWAVCNIAYNEVSAAPAFSRAAALYNWRQSFSSPAWTEQRIREAGFKVRKFRLSTIAKSAR